MKQDASKIRLRPLEPEDLDVLYQVENDREIWQAGITNVPYSRYALHQYIASSTNDIYADRQLRLMVENAEGRVVGILDLVNFDPRHRRAEVGVVIRRDDRRRGYAVDALTQLVGYAREILHVHQLYAIVDKRNAASLGLFEKAGFCQQMELKDWLFDGQNYHCGILLQFFL